MYPDDSIHRHAALTPPPRGPARTARTNRYDVYQPPTIVRTPEEARRARRTPVSATENTASLAFARHETAINRQKHVASPAELSYTRWILQVGQVIDGHRTHAAKPEVK